MKKIICLLLALTLLPAAAFADGTQQDNLCPECGGSRYETANVNAEYSSDTSGRLNYNVRLYKTEVELSDGTNSPALILESKTGTNASVTIARYKLVNGAKTETEEWNAPLLLKDEIGDTVLASNGYVMTVDEMIVQSYKNAGETYASMIGTSATASGTLLPSTFSYRQCRCADCGHSSPTTWYASAGASGFYITINGPVTDQLDNNFVKGDADGDGKLSAADAICILRHIVGKLTMDSSAMRRADFNGDGNVSAVDSACILRHLVGID